VKLGYPDVKVDVSRIPGLEALHVDRSVNVVNFGKCKGLKELTLGSYNPSSKNMEELAHLENLRTLRVYQASVDSLKGLGGLHRLAYLIIDRFPNLHYFEDLEKISDSMLVLSFDGCKKIENFDYVSKLKSLQVLKFINCGAIPSIKFIKLMPNLRAFVFGDTNIVDGDLSHCIGLEFVGFLGKKHYSHKWEDFNKKEISPELAEMIRMQ
jgi:protein phosphatase 1 regulatory subunit 7